MKSIDIVKEELSKAGVAGAEVLADKLVKCVCEAIVPRLAAEADEAVVKGAATVLLPIIAVVEPMAEKAIDLNHDGKIG